METAVIVIDVINDFVYGALGSERAEKIVPNIRRLLRHARGKVMPIIYVTDAHLPGVDREFEIWGSHAVEGSEGAQVIDAVKPMAGDHHIKKRRYSAFYATGLDALLRELGVDTLVLTGLVTNICVQHTAADAFFLGYRIIVPEDCVEAPSDEAQRTALGYIQEMYGVEITSSGALMEGGL